MNSILAVLLFSCVVFSNDNINDLLSYPGKIRIEPPLFFCDFDGTPKSGFTLNGFTRPLLKRNRITTAWGVGNRSELVFAKPDNDLRYVIFRIKSHASRRKTPQPVQITLNSVPIFKEDIEWKWKHYCFEVDPALFSQDKNILAFNYIEAESPVEIDPNIPVAKQSVIEIDYLCLSKEPMLYPVRYKYEMICNVSIGDKTFSSRMEPFGSIIWSRVDYSGKALLRFGLIIDATPAEDPWEIRLVHRKGSRTKENILYLDSDSQTFADVYEGDVEIPFNLSRGGDLGISVQGPQDGRLMGRAGFYKLEIIQQ